VSTEVIDPLGDDPPDPAPLAGVLADRRRLGRL
jgi:hypothetical protein